LLAIRSSASIWAASLAKLARDGDQLVIATAKKLDQAKAVTERIGQDSYFAPNVDADFSLRTRPGRYGAVESDRNVVDDYVEVHWRPVTIVVTRILTCTKRAADFCRM
jgi:hypothetical protein